MRMLAAGALTLASAAAGAAEVTVRNDSVENFSTVVIVGGFSPGEKAASWLTSPCDGHIRAVQVFWRSQTGTSGEQIHDSILIYRGGIFPTPGALAETIGGPVLNDGVINEWRFIDENNVIPINIPVEADETFVVAFTFAQAPILGDPSVVRDTDGIQPNRNAIHADLSGGFTWFNSQTLGVMGDWVIRAVIDCPAAAQEADVGVGMSADADAYTAGQPLTYTIVVDNAGPAASPSTTLVDIFPPAFTGVTWSCLPSSGATCIANGSGNITQIVSLPAGSSLIYSVQGVIAPGTIGTLANTLTAVVGGGISDLETDNNTATLNLEPMVKGDLIFADDFEHM